MHRKILGGVAATAAALAIAAPAHAQEVIPPAQPSTPTPSVSPAQPAAPAATIGFGSHCSVARSRHGYTYAVCSVQAANVPAGQTATLSYSSNLRAFKPRTNGTWSGTTGTISLSNDSVSGSPSNVTTNVKLAFKGKTVAQVRKELVIAATGSSGAGIVQPIAGG
ncbi:hypothetical protein DVA67_027875 [Solirubrobacter sp. CPCC 204708]|uniref:Uncharacterized protein n=1 Tax=Solirubrobacter deserti TaxID=2282478 RepID=A0ABT4RJF5_9ACTN|nr:hypothetical protein [Solirubrobacter deserti]MBE2319815.1 hypothetical protein [Solirubrobacter deserti]MDA0138704.1 hypothetical protein [Solirubrobacter deserti]